MADILVTLLLSACLIFVTIGITEHSFNNQYKNFAIRQLTNEKPHNYRLYKCEISNKPKQHYKIIKKYADKYLSRPKMIKNDYSEQKGYMAEDLIKGFSVSAVVYVLLAIGYSAVFYFSYADTLKLGQFVLYFLKLITEQVLTIVTVFSIVLSFVNLLVISSFEKYGIYKLLDLITLIYFALMVLIMVNEYLYKKTKISK